MDTESLLSETFQLYGFQNVILEASDDVVKLRTNVFSESAFDEWKEVFSAECRTTFRKARRLQGGEERRKAFGMWLVCQHNRKRHKGVKKTHTGCPVTMKVVIRKITKFTIKKDCHLEELPCFIEIHGKHNHSTNSTASLKELSVLPSIRAVFNGYFEQGMSGSQAARIHTLKQNLRDKWVELARRDTNPTLRAVLYMWSEWKQLNQGGLSDDMFASLERLKLQHPEVSLEVRRDQQRFCVALVTPFMRRCHQQLREAGEVVFVDATASLNRLDTAVFPLLCAGPAGAVPLGVLVTSSQEQSVLTEGFRMLKEALGDAAFFGRGHPVCFMADMCEAERSALAAAWPGSLLFVCAFQLLQRVWRWLVDRENGVGRAHRRELVTAAKTLVYAQSEAEFTQSWYTLRASKGGQFPQYISFLESLVARRQEWALTYRAGVCLQGRDTNNFAEASACVIKDIIITRHPRCKAYSGGQLVTLLLEVWDSYLSARLLDLALGRRRRLLSAAAGPADDLEVQRDGEVASAVFTVTGRTAGGQSHQVDLAVGSCTCGPGQSGVVCRHQLAAAEEQVTVTVQQFTATAEQRWRLAVLAVGQDKAPPVHSFSSSTETADSTDQPGASQDEHAASPPLEAESWLDDLDDPAPMADSGDDRLRQALQAFQSAVRQAVSAHRDGETAEALLAAAERVRKIRTSSQLNTALDTLGRTVPDGVQPLRTCRSRQQRYDS